MPATTLPFFIRGEFDGSRLAPDIKAAGDKAGLDFKAAFDRNVESIRGTIADVASRGRNAFGAIDLGVGNLERQAAQQRSNALAAGELAAAQRVLLGTTKDLSAADRLFLNSLDDVAQKEAQRALAFEQSAREAGQLQAQLDATARANGKYTVTTNQSIQATGRQAQALGGAVQQFQDIGISIAGGQRASTVFIQQVPQLAFALQGLEGSTNKYLGAAGRLGTFLSGPAGFAVLGIGAAAAFGLEAALSSSTTATKLAETGAKRQRWTA